MGDSSRLRAVKRRLRQLPETLGCCPSFDHLSSMGPHTEFMYLLVRLTSHGALEPRITQKKSKSGSGLGLPV